MRDHEQDVCTVVRERYPRAVEEAAFVREVSAELSRHGFDEQNSIACVCTCRDEISQTLHSEVTKHWGLVFDTSSLAGMVLAGKTGLNAAQAHSPVDRDGRERYVFLAMPHIAIGPDGEEGAVPRLGRLRVSHACGALISVLELARDGRLDTRFDPDDIELSLLKQKVAQRLVLREAPDLFAITEVAHSAIVDDLERALELTFDPEMADMAVLTGIQIHGPDGHNYVQPKTGYAVVRGERRELEIAGSV